jgi:cyclopropane fatty-acyl-phospholipid synthase-like methyltransferase
MLDTNMGPNVPWLAEWASQVVPLHEGARVLDLGCGKAASSIFLAKEFGVTVWAVDLWIKPTDNWERIEAADVSDRVLLCTPRPTLCPSPRATSTPS